MGGFKKMTTIYSPCFCLTLTMIITLVLRCLQWQQTSCLPTIIKRNKCWYRKSYSYIAMNCKIKLLAILSKSGINKRHLLPISHALIILFINKHLFPTCITTLILYIRIKLEYFNTCVCKHIVNERIFFLWDSNLNVP